MLEDQIQQLQAGALERIQQATNIAELGAVGLQVLGRKGSLAQISKEFGKLTPEERAAAGKALNAAKEAIDSAFGLRKQAFDADALNVRLESEWIDLTLPAPGPRPGSLHPVTQVQMEIEDLFTSLGFAVLDGPEVETEYHNFDALNIPADTSGARHAGYVLAHRRQSAPDAHLARSGSGHGTAGSAAAYDCAWPCFPQ